MPAQQLVETLSKVVAADTAGGPPPACRAARPIPRQRRLLPGVASPATVLADSIVSAWNCLGLGKALLRSALARSRQA